MKANQFLMLSLILLFSMVAGACRQQNVEAADMANPAAVYCKEQGYIYHIHEDEQGNQYGVCVFAKGDECDAWAFYRGECGPQETVVEPQPEAVPTNTLLPKPTESSIEFHPYEDPEFGLALSYPDPWMFEPSTLVEATGDYPASQLLQFTHGEYKLTLHYKHPADSVVIGGGLGAGEIVEGKPITILGQTVPQMLLVYEKKVKLSWVGLDLDDLILYAKLEDTAHHDYDAVNLSEEMQEEARKILTSLTRTTPNHGNPDSEEVDGWVGVLVSASDMPQVDDYFQMLDQNGSRYGIDSLDPAIREALEAYRDTGILISVWGTLYHGRMDAYNTQIEVVRYEEYQD